MLLERLLATEQRGQVMFANPRDPVLANWWGLANLTEAGIAVTPETATRLTAVFGCVRILAESVATLGANVYRRLEQGKRIASNHPLWKLIHLEPNPQQTAFEWLEMEVGHLCLRGNAYNRLEYPSAGPLSAIWPLHPDHVRPFRDKKGAIWYEWAPPAAEKRVFSADEILHFRVFSDDGMTGKSVIDANREAVGLGIAAERFGSRFFTNGVVPSGNYSVPGRLSDQAYNRLKAQLKDQATNSQHRPMILEDGLKWESLSVRPDQAQFLETRRFQIAEIARMFRVPPHMLADLDRATFNNIEHLSQEFVTFTLLPWLTRLEQRMNTDLLTETGKRSFFVRFDVSQMLRGDATARANLYKTGFNTGAFTPNDIREMEDRNPVTGGDVRYVPINMQPAAEPPSLPAAKGARTFARLITDCWRRAITGEVKALCRMLEAAPSSADSLQIAIDALESTRPLLRRQLVTMAEVMAEAYERGDAQRFVDSLIAPHTQALLEVVAAVGAPQEAAAAVRSWEAERSAAYIEQQITIAADWAAGSADHGEE